MQGVYCTTDLSAVAIGNLMAVPTGVIQLNVASPGLSYRLLDAGLTETHINMFYSIFYSHLNTYVFFLVLRIFKYV